MKTKELMMLRQQIPYGKLSEISETTGFSNGYLSKFFMGAYRITSKNALIIREAQRIVKESEEKISKILSKYKQ